MAFLDNAGVERLWHHITAKMASYFPMSGGAISGHITPDDAYMYDLGSSDLPWGIIYAGTFNGTATKAEKLISTVDAGSSSQPIYFNEGVPAAVTSVGIEYGGTGGNTAADARTNLSVYSKTETDSAITDAIKNAVLASWEASY